MLSRSCGQAGLVACLSFGLAPVSLAQPVAPPTIHRATLQPDQGVLTISGSGLGPDLQVTVDGQPVPQLPGATDTQIEVLSPVSVVTMSGTYRLTVVDPMRRVGDDFVVAGPPAGVLSAGRASSGHAAAGDGSTPADGSMAFGSRRPSDVARQEGAGPSPLAVIEDPGMPYRTAIGHQALVSNTSGLFNTASGYQALTVNTIGGGNTGNGYQALTSNTSGISNTASGAQALFVNTTGNSNSAAGYQALALNTTGSSNVSSGYQALFLNTSGNNNSATGAEALRTNTTGRNNTASGSRALYGNTSGMSNVALGQDAGYNATTGSYNVFLGADVVGTAGDTNTIRIGLPYDGSTGRGQNQTFIAGIRGTQLTGSVLQVFVDANGQLGTLTPPIVTGTGTTSPSALALAQQVREQQATIAELQRGANARQATIDELRARLARLEAATTRRR